MGAVAEYRFTDYDGRRPDWGKHTIDWSVLPLPLVELFRNGIELELKWLTTLAARTRKFQKRSPELSESGLRYGYFGAESPEFLILARPSGAA